MDNGEKMKVLRRSALVASAALAVAGASVAGAAPSQAAVPVVCTTTMTGTYPAIDVPAGATCTLDGATVKGNVKVGIGSTLLTKGADIKGNTMGKLAARVEILDTNVWGQIHFTRTAGPITIGVAGCKVDPVAGGNINLQNNFGPIAICQMTVRNNIILHNNHKSIGVFDNRVGNNIQAIGNHSNAIRLRNNVMRGNLLVHSNVVAKQLQIQDNTIGGNGNCLGNVIAPVGSGNTAGGALAGQCSGLG